MQQQTEMKKLLAQITPSQEEVNAMTVEAINLGAPTPGADGLLTFDYFLKASKILQKYITRFTEEGLIKRAAERRQLLRDKKDE